MNAPSLREQVGLLSESMMGTDEFMVTEAGMRACVETIHTMSHAMTELSRQVEAANEAIIILSHEVQDLRDHQSRIPA